MVVVWQHGKGTGVFRLDLQGDLLVWYGREFCALMRKAGNDERVIKRADVQARDLRGGFGAIFKYYADGCD